MKPEPQIRSKVIIKVQDLHRVFPLFGKQQLLSAAQSYVKDCVLSKACTAGVDIT